MDLASASGVRKVRQQLAAVSSRATQRVVGVYIDEYRALRAVAEAAELVPPKRRPRKLVRALAALRRSYEEH